MRHRTRAPRRALVTAWLAGVCLAAAGASSAAASSAPVLRVITESQEQVLFEVVTPAPSLVPVTVDGRAYTAVTLTGFGSVRDPGEPDLPANDYLIALPPGSAGVAQLVESETVPYAATRPLPVPEERIDLPAGTAFEQSDAIPDFVLSYHEDPDAYASDQMFPPQAVECRSVEGWRHYRVLPVRVFPLVYDSGSGTLRWMRRMLVRVTFVAAGDRDAGASRYLLEEPAWDDLFRRSIINYGTGRGFKVRPTETPVGGRTLPAGSSAAGPRSSGAFEFRVAIDTTRIVALPFSTLAAAGLTMPDVEWSDLKVVVRDYDDQAEDDPWRERSIAFLAQDADGDGRFGAGDSLVFYAEDGREFFALSPGEQRYGAGNVYWVLIGAGPGVTIDSRPSWFGWTGLTPQGTYRRTIHFETNLYYTGLLVGNDSASQKPRPQDIRSDHYNWTNPEAREGAAQVPLKVVPLRMPAVQSVTQVCVHLQGQNYISGSTSLPHRPRLWLSRAASPAETTWAFPRNPYIIPSLDDALACTEGATIPLTVLGTGRNYLKIYVPVHGDGIDDVDGDQVGIDWAEVTFRGLMEVREHRLLAPLDGLTGPQQLRVSKLATQDVLVLDLADPRHPVRLTAEASQFVWSTTNNAWDLRLQIDCGSGTPAPRILVVEGRAFDELPSGAVTLHTGGWLDHFAGEDYVAVYAERFASEIEPLLTHREGQQHRVLRAPIQEVYDTYSGGRAHPYAIKRLLRRMWRESNAPPDYLLLVGDASNDIAGYSLGRTTMRSDTNYVPTVTIPGHYFGSTGTQIVTSDEWFVDHLGGAWDDLPSFFQDMHVGRVSCGTPEEAHSYVEKVLAYEGQDETASWRTRHVMLSDDDFSGEITSIGGSGVYKRRNGEWRFLDFTRRNVASIFRDSLLTYFQVDSLYLNALLDSVPDLGRCVRDPGDPTRCQRDEHGNIVRIGFDVEIDLVPIKAYAVTQVRPVILEALNRGALVWAFQGHSNRTQLTHEEVFRHTPSDAQGDVFRLDNVGRPFVFFGYGCHLADFALHWEGDPRRGDAMVERMLFCCPGALRAGIGVVASTDYESIGHNFQEKVGQAMFEDPPLDSLGARRWRLGELMTRAKLKLASTQRERLTYTLLGDPALRLGVLPPVMWVTLNGEPWTLESGEYASTRQDDSLTVVIELADESSVGLPEVYDYGGLVPAERLKILEERGTRRRVVVEYRTQIQRRDYRLIFQARDYDGALRETEVRVPLAVQVFEQVEDALEPLAAGDRLRGDARLAVTVRTASHLAPTDVTLTAGGVPVALERADLSQVPGAPFLWTLRFAELPVLPVGTIPVEVAIAQHDGPPLTLAALNVDIGSVALQIAEAQWVPNPFSAESHLVYRLTGQASRARLRIFTNSGREILDETTLPPGKGTRHFLWDGRDADGDAVANGLYFYEFTIWGPQGKVADRVLDKVVRVR